MHHDAVTSCPSNVSLLGSSPACEIQGMFVPGQVLTLQGHPEFGAEIMKLLLNATDELGFEDRTLWEDALARAEKPHDGALIAAAILEFLYGKFD